MPRRLVVFVLCAVLAAAVCVRLGFWQLSRLAERRARNAVLASHLTYAPVGYAALPRDTLARHYRRVRVAGRPDYAREFVLADRSRQGAPGVHIITPVRVAAGGPGGDTLALVDRGWFYSPDGASADLSTVREGDSLDVIGYVELPSRRPGPARRGAAASGTAAAGASDRGYRAYRYLDPAVLAADIGAPVTRDYIVAEPPPDETRPPYNRLKRIPTPEITDEGPHQSYAIQWFSFALVSIVGAGVFVRAERRKGRGDNTRFAAVSEPR